MYVNDNDNERTPDQWRKLLRDELLCYYEREELDGYFGSGCTFIEGGVIRALDRINTKPGSQFCQMLRVWDYDFVDSTVSSFGYFYCATTDDFFHQFQSYDFVVYDFQTFDWRWINGNEDGWYVGTMCSSYPGLVCSGSSSASDS
jgi:hypothetical protein